MHFTAFYKFCYRNALILLNEYVTDFHVVISRNQNHLRKRNLNQLVYIVF